MTELAGRAPTVERGKRAAAALSVHPASRGHPQQGRPVRGDHQRPGQNGRPTPAPDTVRVPRARNPEPRRHTPRGAPGEPSQAGLSPRQSQDPQERTPVLLLAPLAARSARPDVPRGGFSTTPRPQTPTPVYVIRHHQRERRRVRGGGEENLWFVQQMRLALSEKSAVTKNNGPGGNPPRRAQFEHPDPRFGVCHDPSTTGKKGNRNAREES